MPVVHMWERMRKCVRQKNAKDYSGNWAFYIWKEKKSLKSKYFRLEKQLPGLMEAVVQVPRVPIGLS